MYKKELRSPITPKKKVSTPQASVPTVTTTPRSAQSTIGTKINANNKRGQVHYRSPMALAHDYVEGNNTEDSDDLETPSKQRKGASSYRGYRR